MEYFKWCWDKITAVVIGIIINIVTPQKEIAIFVSLVVIALFLLVTYILFKKRPKFLGIKTAYVATGIVFNIDYSEVLLSYHKNQKMWIPPGGHISSNKWLHDTVIELIKEESGYDVEFFPFHDSKEFDNICVVVPQPFRVQIENQIPSEGHQTHYDFLYIFTVKERTQSQEHTLESKWVPIDEVEIMASKRETYKDVADIIKAALAIVKATRVEEVNQ